MGINGSYVDDLLQGGADEWRTHSDATLERFETFRSQKEQFTFSGLDITESDIMYHINQDFCMSKIGPIPYNSDLGKFASVTLKLERLANNIPT